MKLAIMQPYFFPYIGYWQLINAVDKYVIADDVTYIKQGWINRNRILVNGESYFITLHLHGKSSNKLIYETQLSPDTGYIRKMLRTIEVNYKKAPYFNSVFPLIENIITNDEKNLAKYLEYLIREVSSYLSIETEFLIESKLGESQILKGQDGVIQVCKLLEADEYINPIGGQALYSRGAFAENGIQLKFLKPREIVYKQFRNEFVPNLSIIDVLMFNSREKVKAMLEDYDLIV